MTKNCDYNFVTRVLLLNFYDKFLSLCNSDSISDRNNSDSRNSDRSNSDCSNSDNSNSDSNNSDGSNSDCM